ncbi:MAG: SusC/RagA family TonB-linked outer membrane protein [Balneolaceae bacterium]|nr:MAG: SusC/RagA family TonB-linked outer membrane protein [Balneolaceae bacterium]
MINKILRYLSCLVVMLLFAGAAMAQTGTLTGTITDQRTGELLPGVNIYVQELERGAATGIDGDYTIANIPYGTYTVIVSFVGYESITEQIVIDSSEKTRNFEISESLVGLEEVVVTALGRERERRSLAYTIQSVEADQIRESGSRDIISGLQGRIAGLEITPGSGMPGASASMRIRGANSLTGNNAPLFVIDGIPVASSAVDGGNVFGVDAPNRILDLNPNDIENVSVLKGSSAAVLYGTRASNGAILITTRGGGTAPENQVSVQVSSSLAFDEVSRTPDLQSTYAQGFGGVYQSFGSFSWGPRIEDLPSTITDPRGVEVPAPTEAIDNVSPFFQTGVTSDSNIDIRGANPNGNYSLGIGYVNQDGIIPTTGMERASFRLGGEYLLSERLRIGGRANYSNTSVDQIRQGSDLSNPMFTLYWAPRSFDLWGTPYAEEDDPYSQINYRGAMDNPRWSLANNENTDDTDRIFGNIFFDYELSDWLSVNYRLGGDFFNNRRKQVLDLGSGATGGAGQITEFNRYRAEVTSYLNLEMQHTLTEDISIRALLGNEINRFEQKTEEIVGSGLSIGGFRNISNAASINADESIFRSLVVGVYGDLEANYRNMLFLNLSARNDWSSTLPVDNNSFFYPSVGATLVFTEAFNMPDFLSYGSLKASWAQVGQAAPIYGTIGSYSTFNAGSGFLADGITFPFQGVTGLGLSNQLPGLDLEPQNNTTIELGTELSFAGERINFEYTWYRENAINQIFAVPTASSSGFTTHLRNAGELQNEGHEVMFNVRPIQTPEFMWDVTLNFAQNTSEVIELAPGVSNIFLGGFVDPNIRAMEGFSYPIIFGSAYVRDDDGNIVYNSDPDSPTYGFALQDSDLQSVGDVSPDWTGSITNRFNYRNIGLSFMFDIRQGGDMWSGNTRLQKLYGMDAMTEDRETPVVPSGSKGFFNEAGELVIEGENDIEILKDLNYWLHEDLITESNVYDTSFIRLRQLTLSYNLSQDVAAWLPVDNAEFYFTGRNLFLSTDYPNWDPETNLGGDSNFQGLEYVNLPGSRSFIFGVRLSI